MRIPQLNRHQIRCPNLQDSQVGVRILTNLARSHPSAIRQNDVDVGCTLHNMAVGEDIAVWCKDKARAGTTTALLRISRISNGYFDINDRLADGFGNANDCLRIGVEQLGIRVAIGIWDSRG